VYAARLMSARWAIFVSFFERCIDTQEVGLLCFTLSYFFFCLDLGQCLLCFTLFAVSDSPKEIQRSVYSALLCQEVGLLCFTRFAVSDSPKLIERSVYSALLCLSEVGLLCFTLFAVSDSPKEIRRADSRIL
jgi:hypothetical protein